MSVTTTPASAPRSLEALIAQRYPSPEWATFFEVANGTGFSGARRWADAVTIGIWPSRGMKIHGFECKRSRSDWLRELAEPSKADAVMRFCDHWWLVTSDPSVAAISEVPETWGMLTVRGSRLHVVSDAPKLEPTPLTRAFVAAVLRRSTETTIPKAALGALVEAESEKLSRHRRDNVERDFERVSSELAELKTAISAFTEASGISIDRWTDGKELGEAVRFVQRGGLRGADNHVRTLRDRAEQVAKLLTATLAEVTT